MRGNEYQVICPVCKQVIVTAGNEKFRHCKINHLIKENLISSKDQPLEADKTPEKETSVNVVSPPSREAKIQPVEKEAIEEELVIEESEEEEEINPDDYDYHCPECNELFCEGDAKYTEDGGIICPDCKKTLYA
jgi:hypothetical protein